MGIKQVNVSLGQPLILLFSQMSDDRKHCRPQSFHRRFSTANLPLDMADNLHAIGSRYNVRPATRQDVPALTDTYFKGLLTSNQ